MNRRAKEYAFSVGIFFTASLAIPGYMTYSLYHAQHPIAAWITIGVLAILILINWILVWRSSLKSTGSGNTDTLDGQIKDTLRIIDKPIPSSPW
jgi:hypothetical protein